MLDKGSLGVMLTVLAFTQSLSMKPGDLAGHSLRRPEGLVLSLSVILRPLEDDPAGTKG